MEEEVAKPQAVSEAEIEPQSPVSEFPIWVGTVAFGAGFFLILSPPLLKLAMGEDAGDAFWEHALRSLSWTWLLRTAPGLLFVFGCLCAVSGHILRKGTEGKDWFRWLRLLAHLMLGIIIAYILVHFLLDSAFFRGAFILLPAAFGFALLGIFGFILGFPNPKLLLERDRQASRDKLRELTNLALIIFCAGLIMPAVPAMLGIAASPPSAPGIGYGSAPGPNEVVTEVFPYQMPIEVEEIIGDIEGEIEFSVYLTLPVIPIDGALESIPLAVMMHGFGNPYWQTYVDWGTTIAARGVAVAFIQYPSDVHPAGVETFTKIEAQGMSNHPQHFPRHAAVMSGIELLDEIALSSQRDTWVEEVLGNTSIDPSHLWVGGHSFGAGLVFPVLDEAMQRGWGNESLFVALEAPYAHSVDETLRGDMSGLPDHMMAHIALSEDDTSVSPCYGVWHQKRLLSRDSGVDLEPGNILLLTIPSDRHGFPRMVATHFIQATQTHDSLADWGFYRRADAQSDWLVGRSRGDVNTETWAESHLVDGPQLRGMGVWSDGTPVKEISVETDAIHNGTQEHRDCADEESAWQ